MEKSLPDKWVRKAVSDAIDGMVVDGITIPCYDTNVTRDVNADEPDHYVLMTTQTNEVNKANKCEWEWDSSILLDVVTSYKSRGNTGSRLLADNILDKVRDQVKYLQLDAGSGLEVIDLHMSFPADLATDTRNEIIYRKFLRLELKIN